MKSKNLSLLIMLAIMCFSYSCDKEEGSQLKLQQTDIEGLKGIVQKGPFNTGSTITIFELDKNLNQTGLTFTTQIVDNLGNFEFEKIALSSQYVEIQADGFYFNEVTGVNSDSRLNLYAIADISNKTSVNINLLTNLERDRIRAKIKAGNSFFNAKKSAQAEIFKLFSIENSDYINSENLNIAIENTANSSLLAISAILQGGNTTAELSELLATILADIKNDGTLDDAILKSKLSAGAQFAAIASVKNNLEKKYKEMGQTISLSGYAKHISNFIAKNEIIEDPYHKFPAEGFYGKNILSLKDNDTIIPNNDFAFAAEVNKAAGLKIVLTGDDGAWFYSPMRAVGWVVSNFDQSKMQQTFTAHEFNKMIDVPLQFESSLKKLKIDFYNTGETTPYKTKTLNIAKELPIFYHRYSKYGANLLDLTKRFRNHTFKSDTTFSFSAKIPKNISDNVRYELIVSGDFELDETTNQGWIIIKENSNIYILKGNPTVEEYDLKITLKGTGGCKVIENNNKLGIVNWLP